MKEIRQDIQIDIARADITDLVDISKEFVEMRQGMDGTIVKEIKDTQEGISVKLYNKQKAIDFFKDNLPDGAGERQEDYMYRCFNVAESGKDGDEKLIKGNTYGMTYVTKANECHPEFLKEVFDRTLSSADRRVFHDLNSKEEEHWYYTDILKFHEEQKAQDVSYGYNYGHFTIVIITAWMMTSSGKS